MQVVGGQLPGGDSPSWTRINWGRQNCAKQAAKSGPCIDWLWEICRTWGPCRSSPSYSDFSCLILVFFNIFSILFDWFLECWLQLSLSSLATSGWLQYYFFSFLLSISFHYIGLYVIATVTHLHVLRASPVFGCLIIKRRKVESP